MKKQKRLALAVLAYLTLNISCSHSVPKSDLAGLVGASIAPTQGLKKINLKGPVDLRLKSSVGRVERNHYYARNSISSDNENGLHTEKVDLSDFVILAKTVSVSSDANPVIVQTLNVASKNGGMDLHDFALPDGKEKLDLSFDSKGKILHAGDYPENSLYFVPNISLPAGPVAIGDTWTMQSHWSPAGDDTNLTLDMLSILKNAWQCGNETCVEIELSSAVHANIQGRDVSNYKNESRGSMLFSLESGTIVWSKQASQEIFSGEQSKRKVLSELEAILESPSPIVLSPSVPQK